MEDFLKQSWERHVDEYETPPISKEKSPSVSAYEQIKRTVGNLPRRIENSKQELITEYFEELQASIQRYVESIESFSQAKASREPGYDSRKDFELRDENRRRIHNGLISILEVLERLFKQEKLDTSWRSVVGSNRNGIKVWAQEVTEYLRQKGGTE